MRTLGFRAGAGGMSFMATRCDAMNVDIGSVGGENV